METTKHKSRIEFDNNVLNYENQHLYLFESFSGLKIDHLVGYDAIVLEANDADFTRIILKKFRSHSNPEFYLKPIFLINYKSSGDPIIEHLHDGILVSFDQIPEKVNDIQELFVRSTHIDNSPSGSFEVLLMKKILNYMYTRELRSFKPYPNLNSAVGFTYPLLSINFEPFEETKVLEILDWAQKENLIWPDFYDRVYLCNSCGAGHLSYREICPSCDSANMKSEDLIHHFPCGNIGPISDFKNKVDSVLNCPKCNKALRHIGVDYDKPSIINHCLTCNEVFQDYIVKALCLQCKTDSDVQYLVSKNINVYRLTKKGRNAATSGIITSEYGGMEEVFGAVDHKTFNTMMHYEQERIKHNTSQNTTIAVLHIENIYDLLRKLGKSKEKAFITELVQLIRENITPADFINISNPSLILICMNDTVSTDALQLMQKVNDKIEEMVFNNFNKFQLVMHYKTAPLNTEGAFEKQLQELTKAVTEQHD
ncbi:MAG: hypothetical protein K0S33_2678 [Bacteroidetes bacterium]|jgi:GGDEF domain-containing protein|nr:hypothetical protein [Bacteroidota bacterium]